MELRAYQPADLEEIYQLFYDTVHSVNRKDYGLEQLDAWAPRQMDRPGGNNPWRIMKPGWLGKMERSLALAIWVRGGYLDRLYVHKDFVRKGIASALLARLEESAAGQGCRRIYTEASITARPFFERWGYQVVKPQEKPLRGQVFINFVMEKILRV